MFSERDCDAMDHARDLQKEREHETRCSLAVRAPSGVLIGCARDKGHEGACVTRTGITAIPVIDPATSTLIELLTTNARLPYPLHMPLYADVRPDAVNAVQAAAALPGMRLVEKIGATELWNGDNRLIAVVYGPKQKSGRWP